MRGKKPFNFLRGSHCTEINIFEIIKQLLTTIFFENITFFLFWIFFLSFFYSSLISFFLYSDFRIAKQLRKTYKRIIFVCYSVVFGTDKIRKVWVLMLKTSFW